MGNVSQAQSVHVHTVLRRRPITKIVKITCVGFPRVCNWGISFGFMLEAPVSTENDSERMDTWLLPELASTNTVRQNEWNWRKWQFWLGDHWFPFMIPSMHNMKISCSWNLVDLCISSPLAYSLQCCCDVLQIFHISLHWCDGNVTLATSLIPHRHTCKWTTMAV